MLAKSSVLTFCLIFNVPFLVDCKSLLHKDPGVRKNSSLADLLSSEDVTFVENYLHKYGYLDLNAPAESRRSLEDAFKLLVEDLGVSGPQVSSSDVIAVMRVPRCAKGFEENRKKRFVTNKDKWGFTEIRWRFRDPFRLFKKRRDFKVVRSTVRHALRMWAKASNHVLHFIDVSRNASSPVDLDIFFARGFHGDHEPFDGPGGIVAHSGYPMEGKVHFDATERWTIQGSQGIDFRYVALHELGHALGLRHSNDKDAIMHPIYQKTPKQLALTVDDIKGIKFLYGEKIPNAKINDF